MVEQLICNQQVASSNLVTSSKINMRYKMKINEFIKKYRIVKKIIPGVTSSHTPHVICKDGFKMSVQVGQSLYSTPKDVVDNYQEMEVGYPSEEEYLAPPEKSYPQGYVMVLIP